MKNLICFILLFCIDGIAQTKPTLVQSLEGDYQEKNILVRNAFGPGGVGYCVVGVKVNGQYTTDKINADMFQIDLTKCNLKKGAHLKIEIQYQEGCMPVIVNPGALAQPGGTANGSVTINGSFRWQNIFIYNPEIKNGERGTRQIMVNGAEYKTDLKREFLEIDLMSMALPEGPGKLKDGDKLKIEIKFVPGFDPVIINPEAIR